MKLISEVFLGNSLDQLKHMSKSNKSSRSKQTLLLKVLPLEFDRKQAIVIAKEIGIPQRSADSYLKILVEQGKIIKQNHGSYKKYN
jgi:predicted transcriptional regulator